MSRQGRVDIVVLACLDIGGLLLRTNGFSVPFVSQLTYEAWLKRISIVGSFHLDIGGLLWIGEIVVINVVLDVWNIGEIWLLMLLWLISFIALLYIVELAPNVAWERRDIDVLLWLIFFIVKLAHLNIRKMWLLLLLLILFLRLGTCSFPFR